MGMAIRAVGFDLDGTLYPGWIMYAASLGAGLRHPRFYSAFGEARRALRKELASRNMGKYPPDSSLGGREDLLDFQRRFLATRLGISLEEAGSLMENRCYRDVEDKFSRIRPFPGVAACLARLESKGLAIGLLSDLPPKGKVERMGLESRFKSILCSEDFGALKPAARPFLALAEALGTAPEDMAYVGNKIAYDMEGAKALGMKTAYLGKSRHPSVDFSFRSWEALAEWVLSS